MLPALVRTEWLRLLGDREPAPLFSFCTREDEEVDFGNDGDDFDDEMMLAMAVVIGILEIV